ncbi:MAG: insulinase family protein [Reichenbachiella sp.]
MKNLKKLLTICFALCIGSFYSVAQNDQLNDTPVPFHKEIKTGTLDNGLKYFIRKNPKPENRVELRLVVNAGSILEDDDQLGLAHFTEHMAFNGSKNFAKNELVDYLQTVGVKFGAHLNAYTSFDETVYILPIPSDDEEILEKGLTILEDWSGGLLFDQAELDKERGVVIEEWRLGQGAQMRMLQEYLPVIFKGSQYAKRLPIGTKEVLASFDVETIKRFYNDWYRPELMAVIAVGDIDVDKMEERIKEHFSGLKSPESPRERVDFDLPDNIEPLVAITTDKEATNILFNIMFKTDAEEFVTEKQFRQSHVQNLFLNMINQRLSDLMSEANPPYLYASTYIGLPVSRKKTAFSGFSVPKPDDLKTGVVTLLEEIRRVQLHGFNASELKTAKLKVLEGYESAFKEKDKTESKVWADELIRHFLENESVPGIEYEYEFAKKYIDGITVDEVNSLIGRLLTEENRVINMTAPDQEGLTLPSSDEIIEWIKETESKTLEPLVENVIDTNLIKEEITSGKVIASTKIESIDTEQIELSNGAKVFLKKTDFKNDEIQFSAYRSGGISTAEDKDYWSATLASNIIGLSGIGDYSYTDLQKALAGKSVGLSPFIGNMESGMNGSSSPEDVDTMLQLAFLYFTSVRKDEAAYESLLKRNEAALANVLSNPTYYFQDKKARIMSQNHLRGDGIPTIEDLRKSDLDNSIAFFKSQFTSPGDFTFWFVGNFEKETLIPQIEKYLGSVASTEKESKWVDRGLRPPSGMVDEKIMKGTEPKSSVMITFTDEFKYSRKNSYYLRCLSEVLDIKLIEILREEKGGVYGVGASGSGSKTPYERFNLTIQFPCGPENVDSLTVAALGVIKDIQENGVTNEDLEKIKETQRREMELNWKENSYWMSVLKLHFKSKYDYKETTWLNDRIEDLSAKDLQKVAKKYINTEEFIRIALYPEGE